MKSIVEGNYTLSIRTEKDKETYKEWFHLHALDGGIDFWHIPYHPNYHDFTSALQDLYNVVPLYYSLLKVTQ